jgi:hypothetical protein
MWAALLLSLALLLGGCGGGGKADATPPVAPPTDSGEPLSGPGTGPMNAAAQRAAVRLADQASFGATEPLLQDIYSRGAPEWLATQMAATGSRYTSGRGDAVHINDNGNFCLGREDTCWRDWFSSEPLLWDFYRNALTQPDQLRQRVAFALAQIVVVSNLEVGGTYGWRQYHNTLLDNAFGNYRDVLRRVVLSPLMGEYLDHVNNDRVSPNENFARELLQLFAVGTCLLNSDGTPKGGNCQATYDNQIVRDYAYALTGWTYPAGGSTVWGCWPQGANCPYLGGDMVARSALHDDKPRTLLGGRTLPASRTPQQALDAVLDSLLAHPNMAPFIGRQLIQHLVKSNPSDAYVQRVATAFASGRHGTARSFGSGQPGDLAATVAAVLLDTEARAGKASQPAEKMREPVLATTGMLRAMNGRTDGEALGWWWGGLLRQHVFRSPSVFNYYPPNFPVPGTAMVGPAFGIYNPNTALAMINFANQLIYWGGAQPAADIPGATGTAINLTGFEADADDAAKLTDRFINLALGGRFSATARQHVIDAVSAFTPTAHPDNWRSERTRTAAYLVLTSPAYLVLQ